MPHVAAVTVTPAGVTDVVGDLTRLFRLASIAKVITAWAVLVAVEEGSVALDQTAGPPGSTLRHLLSHASGLPFDGEPGCPPLVPPATRRIYSNAGIEEAARTVERSTGIAFADYLAEAVLQPLGMAATELRGSPAHALWSTAGDVALFAHELLRPRLVHSSTALEARTSQFPTLKGLLPGIGPQDPNSWGLGSEIRDHKSPHWTGSSNSPDTFGHFGGAGTFMWVDPRRDLALVALTDRPFDDWESEALTLWPALSDAVIGAQPAAPLPGAASA